MNARGTSEGPVPAGACGGAWRAFLSSFTPIVFKLLDVYLPSCRDDRPKELWQEALRVLAADRYERLKALPRWAEREFLIELRALVFEVCASTLDVSGDAEDGPPPKPDAIRALVKGVPLGHQEVLFLKLAGYSDPTLEKILRVPHSMIQRGLERLPASYSFVLGREQDACLWPSAWLELLREAGHASREECVPRRQLIRILAGQTTWYEKGPAEEHLAGCLHCLESWCALREVNHWQRESDTLSSDQIDTLVAGLPVPSESKAERSYLAKQGVQ